MKRILVTDDERPVIETISMIVRRELAGEFEVVGHAMSGRDAIEKAAALSPDIILMDVRMPGLSGLDAIREIRKRGSSAVFILVTAYERFEIAREAVELGVIDYLLKPVSKDKLTLALRNAAGAIERRGEAERREIEHREHEQLMLGLVETALLHSIMLGERIDLDWPKYCSVLGILEPCAVAVAAIFLPSAGSTSSEEELRSLHERFRATIRYKTKAFAGPLVAGHCVVLLPLRDMGTASEAVDSLRRVVLQAHGPELGKGYLRMGFGSPRLFGEIDHSWSEALRDVLGSRASSGTFSERVGPGERIFELDETFLENLLNGAPERAWLALERILEPFREASEIASADRYRIISLLGAACRMLARRGLLGEADLQAMMDCEDLHGAPNVPTLILAVRTRFSALVGAIGRAPQWSPVVSRAVAFVRENFGKQMSLEATAYALGISPNRLSRVFSEETGKGFSDYLIEYRIGKAKEMLMQPGASIKQVSNCCGYPDPNYFSRLFKKITGLTPTTFSSGSPEAGDGNA
jgi:two-component system, response regulator YesN